MDGASGQAQESAVEYARRQPEKSVLYEVVATSANLMERVVPKEVPLRQWVLTFPFGWRKRLAQDGRLFGELTRVFVETVSAFYMRVSLDRDHPFRPIVITALRGIVITDSGIVIRPFGP